MQARATYGWNQDWGGPTDTVNEPYVLACAPPRGEAGAPRAVSLATAPCEAPRNALAVQGAPDAAYGMDAPQAAAPAPSFTSVAACIKWLDYTADASTDLVEWIELLRALGAEKLYVYMLQVSGGAIPGPRFCRNVSAYLDTLKPNRYNWIDATLRSFSGAS